jgi:hypothetical protein
MHAIRKTPFAPLSPLVPDPVIEIPVRPIVDAIRFFEVINLTNSPQNHSESLPAFLPDHVPHSRRSDPVSLYTTLATLARTLYYNTSDTGRRATHDMSMSMGKESLCGQDGDGGGTLPHTAEIAGKIHKRSTPNSDTNP